MTHKYNKVRCNYSYCKMQLEMIDPNHDRTTSSFSVGDTVRCGEGGEVDRGDWSLGLGHSGLG